MDATQTLPQDELRALERDRDRIEAGLLENISPLIDEMLRDERRWVVRRKRAIDRVPVSSTAVLHFRGHTEPCLVRDVSPHGAGVDMAGRQPAVGDELCLVLGELSGAPALTAIVRHVTGDRVGLEFVPHGDAARKAAEELSRLFAVCDG